MIFKMCGQFSTGYFCKFCKNIIKKIWPIGNKLKIEGRGHENLIVRLTPPEPRNERPAKVA